MPQDHYCEGTIPSPLARMPFACFLLDHVAAGQDNRFFRQTASETARRFVEPVFAGAPRERNVLRVSLQPGLADARAEVMPSVRPHIVTAMRRFVPIRRNQRRSG